MVMDKVDLQIVRSLLEDARLSHVDLARRVSLSRQALLARLKKLQRAGVFHGFHASISRKLLDLPITAFITLRYAQQMTQAEHKRLLALSGDPRILELHLTAGEDCFIAKVCAASVEDLASVLNLLKATPEPVTSRTTLVLSSLFEKPYPRSDEPAPMKKSVSRGRSSR